jgi:hypothetical protein
VHLVEFKSILLQATKKKNSANIEMGPYLDPTSALFWYCSVPTDEKENNNLRKILWIAHSQ